MIKFFRKIRQNLLMENKTSKYFKYAIGEIVLVVIGILIALQINNWNEKEQNKTKIVSVFKDIQEDLINDIKETDRFYNQFYKKQDSLALKIIQGEYDKKDYLNSENSNLPFVGTFDYPLVISEQSFMVLNENKSIIPKEYKNIIKDLNSLYIEDKFFLNQELNELKSITYSFQNKLYRKPWFRKLLYKYETTEKATNYFKSEAYKSEIMLYRERLNRVQSFSFRIKLKAIQNYLILNQIIGDVKPVPQIINNVIKGNLKISESYVGTYKDAHHRIQLIEQNNLLFWYDENQIYFDKILLTELKKDSLSLISVFDSSNMLVFKRAKNGQINSFGFYKNGKEENLFKKIDND
jgi:hypothetical protein